MYTFHGDGSSLSQLVCMYVCMYVCRLPQEQFGFLRLAVRVIITSSISIQHGNQPEFANPHCPLPNCARLSRIAHDSITPSL
jgi:hypothetical protein